VAGLMIGVTLERGARHVLTPEAEGLLAAVDPLRTHISTSTKGAPRDMSFCSRCQKNSPHTLGALEHFWPRFYLPQVKKAWPRGSTGDLSLGMLLSLTMALAFGSRTASFRVIGSSSPQTR
jgi:hypothetical protein